MPSQVATLEHIRELRHRFRAHRLARQEALSGFLPALNPFRNGEEMSRILKREMSKIFERGRREHACSLKLNTLLAPSNPLAHRFASTVLLSADEELNLIFRNQRWDFPYAEARQLIERNHVRPLLARWLWQKLRLLFIPGEHLLAQLEGDTSRMIARMVLCDSVPSHLKAVGPWKLLVT